MKLKDKNDVQNLAINAAKSLDDKKLENIVLLALDESCSLADYFIIATASSSPQMNAGIGTVYRFMKDEGYLPYGENNNISSESVWALVDYGFLVVHIFTEEGRAYYDLDNLWSDSTKLQIN